MRAFFLEAFFFVNSTHVMDLENKGKEVDTEDNETSWKKDDEKKADMDSSQVADFETCGWF